MVIWNGCAKTMLLTSLNKGDRTLKFCDLSRKGQFTSCDRCRRPLPGRPTQFALPHPWRSV